jgi:oxygen-independent coproporphyrinogen-3 oxidase
VQPTESPAGLYLHLPFCLKKCPYCDFYSITDLSKKDVYIDALIAEMELRKHGAFHRFDTVYLGGGTPSTFSGPEIEKILAKAASVFDIFPAAEITLEINPGTVTGHSLATYRQAGVTRISVGIQSFNDRILKTLGRIHTAGEAADVLRQAIAAGFDHVGLDLIYGIPGQSTADCQADLDQTIPFEVDHISCYMLSFESGTEFENQRRADQLHPLTDTRTADMYRTVVSELARRGYPQYEISNFSRPGCHSLHNVKYWNGTSYVGLGAGAHSFDGVTRSWNCRDVDQYIKSISDGCLPTDGQEKLTRSQHMLEMIYLGLRTTVGIGKNDFERRFQVDFNHLFGDIVNDLQGRGFINENENRLSLTVEGMLLLDAIVNRMSDRIEDL